MVLGCFRFGLGLVLGLVLVRFRASFGGLFGVHLGLGFGSGGGSPPHDVGKGMLGDDSNKGTLNLKTQRGVGGAAAPPMMLGSTGSPIRKGRVVSGGAGWF